MPYDAGMDDSSSAAATIRERARALGFDLVGFAPAGSFDRERELILEDLARGHLAGMAWITCERVRLSCDPERLLPGVRSIVALGTAYAHSEPELPSEGSRRGRIARYARGRDYHDVLRPRLRELAAAIVEAAGPETRCRSFVDTGPLVDRAAAERAGLGFVGKNTCILTGRHGSYVFLSAILTTAELIPPHPLTQGEEGGVRARDCGSCRACLDACPTDAFVGPRQLDATRCISYLTIEHRGSIPDGLRPLMGDWVFGCDVCQEVCPWNRARPMGEHAEFQPAAGASASLDLLEVLSLDEVGFRARFRGTPLLRPKRAGLLRNAAVALGNARDPRAISALLRALADPEPLVRSHAAWALGQMPGLPPGAVEAMTRAAAQESDPDVRREMSRALASEGVPALRR
jgi:epoxyqueuosine reductase